MIASNPIYKEINKLIFWVTWNTWVNCFQKDKHNCLRWRIQGKPYLEWNKNSSHFSVYNLVLETVFIRRVSKGCFPGQHKRGRTNTFKIFFTVSIKTPKPTNVTDNVIQKADASRETELDLIQSVKNPTSMTSSLSNHWFPLKGAPSPRHWTDELRLSIPHGAFCLWNGHAVPEEQRKKHLHSTPVTDHPAFILAAGPVTLLIRFLLVQLLMASSIPILSASLWADTANADGRGLQPSRSQRLETKRAPFVYLCVCVCNSLPPSWWSKISVAGTRDRHWKKSIFNNLRDHRALDNRQ